MEPSGSTNKKSFFSEWLEKLQQESWQLELLISGLALFGIWESRTVLSSMDYYVDVFATNDYRGWLRFFISFFKAAWLIFMINLLIHIIIRGFWIGAIGLRYVSGDIDFDQLNYSPTFTNYFKRKIGSFDDYIERLEKISSVIFSFTFLMFFMLLSFSTFNLFFGVIASILTKINSESGTSEIVLGLFGILYYVMGFIVLIDFLALGALKKIKEPTVSRIYFWIYRFYSLVSLSFFYRPLLLNFIDNRFTRRLFYIGIPYIIILLGSIGFYFERYPAFPSVEHGTSYLTEVNRHAVSWQFYDDLREAHLNTFTSPNSSTVQKVKIHDLSLSKYEYHDGEELKLFIMYDEGDESYIAGLDESIYPFRKSGIRHKVFFKNEIKDEGQAALEEEKVKQSALMRRVINKRDLSEVPDSIIAKYQDYEKDDIERLKDQIYDEYNAKIREYIENRISTIKNELINAHQIKIDDEEVEKMDCTFYIHPNMHERGLLCHISIDSLSFGSHTLTQYKQEKDCDTCYYIDQRVLFRKIK